jgi:dTDP-4-amino-4,6-dideoxygalactose transaminase
MSDKQRIWLSSPHMGGTEEGFVKEAFDSNWIAPLGPNVDGFESDLQDFVGVDHAAVLTSGTAAIHLALVILGVKAGDEVLVSSFTFSGSINPVIYQGATPVMIDSESSTWNMDPVLLEKAIADRILLGKKPKALILVHLYGMPAQWDEIKTICTKYEIPIIEDAAEALGSVYKGRQLGSLGDIGILSFNGNKIITTSGGGALLSSNKEWVEKVRFLATQARDPAVHYEHSEIGYNYRMSNVLAGIGRGQMEVLNQRVEQKRDVNKFYRELLDIEGVSFLTEPSQDFFSNYWLTTIIMDKDITGFKAEDLRQHWLKENIEARPLWKPMHKQIAYNQYPSYTNGTSENLFKNGLCLPSGSNLTQSEFDRISVSFSNFIKDLQGTDV